MLEYQKLSSPEIIADEGSLLAQMANGSHLAFSRIYRMYWEDLFVTAVRSLRDRDGAADVVQDVFVSIWKRRATLKIDSLSAYLHTSVRYKCIHYIEKNITRRDYLARLAETSEKYLSDDEYEQLELKELKQILHEIVGKMPERMQEVYKLSRYKELTHKEIAKRLDISPETVKKHIQHALSFIKSAVLARNLKPYLFILLFFVA